MLNGIDVVLHVKTKSGTDAFGSPTFSVSKVTVSNVLVVPILDDELVDNTNLVGKQSKYTIAIPKGDNHNWTDTYVEFFEKKYKTYGPVVEGIESLVPGKWHKKINCELYE